MPAVPHARKTPWRRIGAVLAAVAAAAAALPLVASVTGRGALVDLGDLPPAREWGERLFAFAESARVDLADASLETWTHELALGVGVAAALLFMARRRR